jgi:hypothetical protein
MAESVEVYRVRFNGDMLLRFSKGGVLGRVVVWCVGVGCVGCGGCGGCVIVSCFSRSFVYTDHFPENIGIRSFECFMFGLPRQK